MLRCLLSHYTGQPARAVQYTRNEWGKPGLADSSLQFNISHTGSWIAFAFTHHHPLGVDIEQWHAIPEAGDIARNYFAERERTALQSVPDDRRQEAFFNLWTRKEACLKALGAGLNLPLDRFEFTVDPCLPARLVAVNGQAEEAAKWSLFQFAPEPDISGCLAIPVKPVKARGWRLDRDLLVCAKTVTI
ncbi:MAG TPA: 4'-phosphopantetheinyl transferase superfamily protein [Verrucomicrobiae bacterium]|nr:4'-phosphopantetheinyl transferase superfamily protein [Verrucomicrobiae bacterium]